ncbi:hypothetical protein BG004_005264 [Podila humilis]|nr:hypothetical protein BG004_005264 [Podila humilis]
MTISPTPWYDSWHDHDPMDQSDESDISKPNKVDKGKRPLRGSMDGSVFVQYLDSEDDDDLIDRRKSIGIHVHRCESRASDKRVDCTKDILVGKRKGSQPASDAAVSLPTFKRTRMALPDITNTKAKTTAKPRKGVRF